MIKIPFNVTHASEETVRTLIELGVLRIDDEGVHANKPGVYSAKREKGGQGK